MENSKNEKVSVKPVNEINVAGKLKIKHWDILKVKLDVEKNDCWDKAFKFFEIRINTRYLEPIKRIQTMNRNHGEGFAMVNLQCSLIETIESFYNGWVYEYPNFMKNGKQAKCPWKPDKDVKSGKIFDSFFKHREPFKGKINGSDFYLSVRCGLLHETQTKRGWVIEAENDDLNCFFKFKKEENKKIIYRNNFQNALLKVIQQYKKEITTGDGLEKNELEELRENFKAKFDHVCDVSKIKP